MWFTDWSLSRKLYQSHPLELRAFLFLHDDSPTHLPIIPPLSTFPRSIPYFRRSHFFLHNAYLRYAARFEYRYPVHVCFCCASNSPVSRHHSATPPASTGIVCPVAPFLPVLSFFVALVHPWATTTADRNRWTVTWTTSGSSAKALTLWIVVPSSLTLWASYHCHYHYNHYRNHYSDQGRLLLLVRLLFHVGYVLISEDQVVKRRGIFIIMRYSGYLGVILTNNHWAVYHHEIDGLLKLRGGIGTRKVGIESWMLPFKSERWAAFNWSIRPEYKF